MGMNIMASKICSVIVRHEINQGILKDESDEVLLSIKDYSKKIIGLLDFFENTDYRIDERETYDRWKDNGHIEVMMPKNYILNLIIPIQIVKESDENHIRTTAFICKDNAGRIGLYGIDSKNRLIEILTDRNNYIFEEKIS